MGRTTGGQEQKGKKMNFLQNSANWRFLLENSC
jgi:hypothetical protein